MLGKERSPVTEPRDKNKEKGEGKKIASRRSLLLRGVEKKWRPPRNGQRARISSTWLPRTQLHHQRVPLEVGKVIQKGRQDKGLTQKDLATKINEKPQIIAEYESGKVIPNNQVMGKIERAITTLP
ncbi:endothelial differentiation-related factor 1 homolog [Sinocyclocheilus rhinocerous]|uniref:endothelial differentiation-related factor 1 homolog n=1 Tax=Sinocyclocheilus rhinocerous TaxID=307959 RepID=UPI0007B93DAC|nr:PREDICTED: endothelial differentiation-related factor 1 homolog [Sinocyclocheilus rhinocerous]